MLWEGVELEHWFSNKWEFKKRGDVWEKSKHCSRSRTGREEVSKRRGLNVADSAKEVAQITETIKQWK